MYSIFAQPLSLTSCAVTRNTLKVLRENGIKCRFNGFNIWTSGVAGNTEAEEVCYELGMTPCYSKGGEFFARHNRKNKKMWKSCVTKDFA